MNKELIEINDFSSFARVLRKFDLHVDSSASFIRKLFNKSVDEYVPSQKANPDWAIELESYSPFDGCMPDTRISADLYSFQIQKEITKMSAKVMEMFDFICNSFVNPKNTDEENEHVKFLENYIDEMNDAISEFLQKCARLPSTNHDDRIHFSALLHITDVLENLSDETCSLMHTVKNMLVARTSNLPPSVRTLCQDLFAISLKKVMQIRPLSAPFPIQFFVHEEFLH